MNEDGNSFKKLVLIANNINNYFNKDEINFADRCTILSMVFSSIHEHVYDLHGEGSIENIKKTINNFHECIFDNFEKYLKEKGGENRS